MKRTRQRGLAAVAAGAFILYAAAAEAAAEDPIDHAEQYRACITLTGRDAWEAFDAATAWRDAGGGAAAEHCAAMALVQLGLFDQAAERLEALSRDLPAAGNVQPADLLAQAANAWLLAGYVDRAEAAVAEALRLRPESPELLVDHARVLAEGERYQDALSALDRALARQPDNADAMAFRAAALRHLGRLDEALAAANQALQQDGDLPSARLERGVIRRLQGDLAGARRDWVDTAARHPGTPAADSATTYLEEMDVRKE